MVPLFGPSGAAAFSDSRFPLVSGWRTHFHRLHRLQRAARHADVLWSERELPPGLPAWAGGTWFSASLPVVADIDVPFSVQNKVLSGLSARVGGAVRSQAAAVIVASEGIAEQARAAGVGQVEIIPGAVDSERFSPAKPSLPRPFTIGWLGGRSTGRYLQSIRSALLMSTIGGTGRVHAIGGASDLRLDGVEMALRQRHDSSVVEELRACDIGVLPLADDHHESLCSRAELLEFMACGIPVVGSPVGLNRRLIDHGRNGFLVATPQQWYAAIQQLRTNPDLRATMGAAARRTVEHQYSLTVIAPRIAGILEEAARHRAAKRATSALRITR